MLVVYIIGHRAYSLARLLPKSKDGKYKRLKVEKTCQLYYKINEKPVQRGKN